MFIRIEATRHWLVQEFIHNGYSAQNLPRLRRSRPETISHRLLRVDVQRRSAIRVLRNAVSLSETRWPPKDTKLTHNSRRF